MDLALEKLNLVLDTFRKLQQDDQQRAHDQEIDDSTRRAVADIDDPADQHKNYRKDKKENKANRKSLTEKMSSMFLNSDVEAQPHQPQETKTETNLSKTPTQGSSLASKLKLFSSSSSAPATPPSASVATLRPPAHDDSDSTTVASSHSTSTAPPPIGHASQPSSSETLPVAAHSHTYPPEPSSTTTAAEPPRRTSTLGKIFSASSSGSRKILEVVTHSNLPGSKGAKAKTASEKRPDPNKHVLDETLVEEPENVQDDDSNSKSVVEFRRMFGLSDKEELLERKREIYRLILLDCSLTILVSQQSIPLTFTEDYRSLVGCTFRPISSVSVLPEFSQSRPR
jgi:hypothetical protein